MKLDSIRHYDAVYLDCQELKNSLASTAYHLSQMLLDKMAEDHREENQRSVKAEFTVMVSLWCRIYCLLVLMFHQFWRLIPKDDKQIVHAEHRLALTVLDVCNGVVYRVLVHTAH